MRIALATHDRTVHGGVEAYLRALLPALATRGHELALVFEQASPGGASVDATLGGATVATCLVAERGRVGALAWLRAWKPDVVYDQGLLDPDLEEAIANEHGLAVFAHGYYGTCVSGTKLRAFPAPRPCTRTLGPGCLVQYLPRRCGGLSPLRAWRDYRVQSRRGALLRRVHVLVASRHLEEEMERHGVPRERLHRAPLFPTGTTCPEEPPRERARTDTVLFLGRMTALKGGEDLIRALPLAGRALGRPLRLVLAGTGPDEPAWRALAQSLGVPARFEGWVDAKRRDELLAEADLLAVPSVWPEPFGLVGIEAGCAGVPAVARAVGGIPEWLIPNESGELASAPPTGPGALADAIARALASSEHHARLRRGAWEVARRFTLAAHVAILEGVLERMTRATA